MAAIDIGNKVGSGPPVDVGLDVAVTVGVSEAVGVRVNVGVDVGMELGVEVVVLVSTGVALRVGLRVRTGLRVTAGRMRVRSRAGVGLAGTISVGISPAEQPARTAIRNRASTASMAVRSLDTGKVSVRVP